MNRRARDRVAAEGPEFIHGEVPHKDHARSRKFCKDIPEPEKRGERIQDYYVEHQRAYGYDQVFRILLEVAGAGIAKRPSLVPEKVIGNREHERDHRGRNKRNMPILHEKVEETNINNRSGDPRRVRIS